MPLPKPFLGRALGLALVLSALATALAHAQAGQPRLHVNNVLEQEPVPGAAGLPGLALTVDFVLLDSTDQVVRGVDPEEAAIAVGAGAPIPASLQKIEVPWTIVLVVDSSRTLVGSAANAAYRDARFALADALEQAPQDTNFAVLTIGSQPATALDFTRDKEVVQTTLRNRLRAGFDQNPCLNNAVYEAVNKLSGASGRRAVLLFSASADGCGQRPAQDVVDLARRNHIEIYGVGLRGYSITDLELRGLAGPTGGIAAMREQNALLFGFQNIMSILDNQWQVKTTLYPEAGPQTATLHITLADGTLLLSDPVSFEADQNYVQPPSVNLRGQVQSTSTGLRFSLDIVSPELISQIKMSVISRATGSALATRTENDVRDTYEIPADNLQPGQELTLLVQAVDRSDRLLWETSSDFTYQPPAPVLTIVRVEPPTDAQPAYLVQISSVNLENAVKYRAWLQQADPGAGQAQPLPGTTLTAPAGDPLLLPVAGLATGSYQAVVQALNIDDIVLAQASSEAFQYQSPSAFEAFVRRVGETRLAIAATTLICVAVFAVAAVAGGIVFFRRTARPKQVMLVLPERKLSAAPAPPLDVSGSLDRPAPARDVSGSLDRPTRLPDPAPGDSGPAPRRPAAPPPRAEPLPPACLSSQEPAEPKFAVGIDRSPFTIGRREGNDLVVRVSSKSGMSGRHATITFAGGRYYLQDDYSSFGTRVNGERLQPGIPIPLEGEAVLELGPSVKVKFVLKQCGE